MKLAVVLVHYHTPGLLESACRALLADAREHAIELEGLVIDNGSRARDREILDRLPFRRLDPGANLGYAGGVNLGLRETAADRVIAMNPDVEVLPGCLKALMEVLDQGAAVCGPRFYWDADKSFLLPPTEEVSLLAEIRKVRAARGGVRARAGRHAWRRHARRHWCAAHDLPSYDLSGALLALHRDAWHSVGPFDEGYRLYFEETDWLQRLRRAGLAARYVPRAEAVHFYAQSVLQENRADAWFQDSSRRFRKRFYGRVFTSFLESLGRRSSVGERDGETRDRAERGRLEGEGMWLEVSASLAGYPAAGKRLTEGANLSDPRACLSPGIWRRLAAGRYFLRTVDARGSTTGIATLEKP